MLLTFCSRLAKEGEKHDKLTYTTRFAKLPPQETEYSFLWFCRFFVLCFLMCQVLILTLVYATQVVSIINLFSPPKKQTLLGISLRMYHSHIV